MVLLHIVVRVCVCVCVGGEEGGDDLFWLDVQFVSNHTFLLKHSGKVNTHVRMISPLDIFAEGYNAVSCVCLFLDWFVSYTSATPTLADGFGLHLTDN